MILRKKILLFLLLTNFNIVFCQPSLLIHNVKSGLSQNTVTCIFQDHKNIIWIGTQDGLNRFDGHRFVQYKYDETDTTSISDQYITAINEDGNGVLLVGTRNGLNLFNRQTEKFIRIYPDLIAKREIQYEFNPIERLENGNLIISGGLDIYEWDMKNKIIQKRINYLEHSTSFSVYKNTYVQIEDDQRIFIHEPSHRPKSIKKEKPEKLIANPQYVDKLHTIWWVKAVAENKTRILFFNIDKKKWADQFIETEEAISKIYFDENNRPFITTRNGIFTTYDYKNLTPVKFGQSPVKTPVLSMLKDRQGLFWIGFTNSGIGLFNPESEAYTLINKNDFQNTCYSTLEIAPDKIWTGTSSGIYQTNSQVEGSVKVSDIPSSYMVVDNSNNIWAGTSKEGLFVLNSAGKVISHFTKENSSLISNTIFHLSFQPKNNAVLISTPEGFCIYSTINKKWQILTAKNGRLAGSYVLHSFTDHKNNVWVSSNLGADVLDSNYKNTLRINSNSDTSKIKRTIITGVAEDLNHAIWIATLSNGIYKYHNSSLIHINTKNGLSSNVIYGIVCDIKNNIWIAGTNGINIFEQQSGNIRKLTKENGLPSTDYNIGSIYNSVSDKIYVTSADGIIRIDPLKVASKKIEYKPFILKTEINYQSVPVLAKYSLNAQDKQISFEFSAPCYINADQLVFQYRLKGFEDKWINISSDNRRASFTNLPFSSMILEIRCAMNLKEISHAPVIQITISRKPPFWKDIRYMIPLSLLALTFIAFGIRHLIKRKTRQQLREAAIAQSISKERERISRDLHDNLGAYAAAIKSNIIQLEQESLSSHELLSQLKENANDMVSALRESIWALQQEYINIISVSDRFKNMINRISPNYPELNIIYKEEIEKNIILSTGECIHLIRIMQEALTNAIKHSKTDIVSIGIEAKDQLIVYVKDFGSGFEYETDQNKYGIRNMKERAAEAGFEFSISSSSKGTTIQIKKC